MKVLLVDDDKDALAPLRDQIGQGFEWREVGFEEARLAVDDFLPDVVVLDIFSGNPSDENATGCDRLESIWNHAFRPVVIYSANPDIVSASQYREHPFVKLIRKGSGSELEVDKAIRGFAPLVELLCGARRRIEEEFSKALRDVAPLAASSGGDLAHVVERAARRRVAALVDEMGPAGEAIAAWEQYVFPPVSGGIRQGDVLCVARGVDAEHWEGAELAPDQYRIVLTPSCDLVAHGDRSPKVENVLLARCGDMNHALDAIRIPSGRSKRKERLRGVLNTGFESHVVPFPRLPGRIPMMAADMRRLELVGFEEIRQDFRVVASVDSPFREAIAWAYVRSTGRPGLPERDVDSWADEIIGAKRNVPSARSNDRG